MQNKESQYKKIFIGAILLLWFIPIMQQIYPFVAEKSLSGDIQYEQDTTLSANAWFDGAYSSQKEKYINENFGFRNFCIRLKNQLYFYLLNIPKAKDIVIGKEDFLYEEKYIKSYTGVDFIGENAIRRNVEKLKFITDTLEKLKISLIVLFAPGKASYYPEFIPEKYFVGSDTTNTNYKWTVRIAEQLHLKYIDYNVLFRNKKSASTYPLYPKTGIHWSVYGMYYAVDTLIKYIETTRAKKMAHFNYDKVELSYDLRYEDGDIAEGLNMFSNILPFKMAYPIVHYEDTLNAYKPRVLVIADSYWKGIHFTFLPKRIFGKNEFWYYNRQIFDYSDEHGDPEELDLKKEIESKDVIILMATEADVKEIGWDFIDEAYDLYSKGEGSIADRRKRALIKRIKKQMTFNPEWHFKLQQDANEKKITLDSEMTVNAVWLIDNDPAFKLKQSPIENIKRNMRSDPQWMKEIERKANDNKISVDSMMTRDAIWMGRKEKEN